jgi:molybdenum cofactor biosynthesis enzyme MoaA
MVNGKQFETVEQMQNSEWIADLKMQMYQDTWPTECERCERTEQINGTSIRLNSIKRDKILKAFDDDYIQLGGTLDNYCNSACITCNSALSTRIGNLKGSLVVNDNWKQYQQLPHNRLVEIDINGGEPSISVNYNHMLDNLPESVKIVRINTNGASIISCWTKVLKLLLL